MKILRLILSVILLFSIIGSFYVLVIQDSQVFEYENRRSELSLFGRDESTTKGNLDEKISIEKQLHTNQNLMSTSRGLSELTQDDTLNLRDFGVLGNGENETEGFQRALNAAVGKVLYIPKQQGRCYLTRELLIPSNSSLVFESNVILEATNDLEQAHANFEALLRIEDVDNVVIKGNNALFRMNKSAYRGEHNHIFMINGSSNVNISRVRANSSGGDGFYIGAYKTKKKYSNNIKIIDCVADNNRRQGMSIISAKDVFVKNCLFSNTKGTSPAAGLDIEPNRFDDVLENIVIEDCSARGNAGRGFMVAISSFDSRSNAVSISFNNCIATGNYVGFASVYFLDGSTGNIFFNNCMAEGSKYSGFLEASCSAEGIKKIYTDCKATNNNSSMASSAKSSFSSSFYVFESERQPRKTIGNSVFKNCMSEDRRKKPLIARGISINESGKAKAKNITIVKFSSVGHGEKPINLNLKSKTRAGEAVVVK